VDDASDTLTLRGQGNAAGDLGVLLAEFGSRDVCPRLAVDGMAVALEEIGPRDDWELAIGKNALALALGFEPIRNETVVVFLSADALRRWALRQLELSDAFRWADKLTILVDGLGSSVFGPQLRCFGLGDPAPSFDHSRANSDPSAGGTVQIAPEALNRKVGQSLLTGGDLDSAQTSCLRLWAERDAALLLCDEVSYRAGEFQVTLRSGRRVNMQLDGVYTGPTRKQLELVQTAVAWCLAEHRDARHALLVDRLALEAVEGERFISFLRSHLAAAVQDARDRYRVFVIDKKDAAAKETRDILKDVRVQADAYATKVRDLTSTFLRDLLAALLLIGLGLLGRMNSDGLAKLLEAAPVDTFFKVLAGYFLLSAAFQIATHWRDLYLTTEELTRWWSLTRTSLPGSEVKRVLSEVIKPRRKTFIVAVAVIALCNLAIAGALWNWKTVLESVLASGVK